MRRGKVDTENEEGKRTKGRIGVHKGRDAKGLNEEAGAKEPKNDDTQRGLNGAKEKVHSQDDEARREEQGGRGKGKGENEGNGEGKCKEIEREK
ncbi:hypothetical protein Pmani_006341 [Petrolisthes manimaculis]|uniref:Uncharacterized protein n=1 Tax=Petrolisthes manimaculis TaxID=1843537 RepID=A0AAE1QAJ4_9EUCA|nr:hypothetical protein Pmani_006341 [Petrolisthes manimaculis]